MPTVLTCDVCHYTRAVPADYSGQKVRCPQCAAVIQIRADVEPPSTDPEIFRKPCPFCAEPVVVEAKKCRFCGEVIDRDLAIAKERERIREIERAEQVQGKRLPGALGSLICGSLAFLFGASVFFSPIAAFLGPVAILLSLQALRERKQKPYLGGARLAQVGFALGVVGLVTFVIVIVTLRPMLKGA